MRPWVLPGVGVTAGALGVGALRFLLRRPLPQVDGAVTGVRGLSGAVEIVRDTWGIPHINARDECDAFFAQGFCHAQDRLWQMELHRRLPRGQLAEVFGPDALDVDRFMRRLGLHRAAQTEWEALDDVARATLEAYAAGVNAWIESVTTTGRLPVEFVLARFQPRPWEPLDSLTFGRYMAFILAPNWETELIRARLVARLGPEAAAALEPDVWGPDAAELAELATPRPAGPPEVGHLPPVHLPEGTGNSNNWVVSGRRSTTGRPLLANDIHLTPNLPCLVYEAHLAGGPDLNVAGASFPGCPGIFIGHNRHIAWGITASWADVQDFYVERLHPTDPLATEYQGRWETGTLVREEIRVKGHTEPWVEEVLVTRHGPLLTPTPALAEETRPLALTSAVLRAPEMWAPLLALSRATDWVSFRAALRRLETPSLGYVYADVEGNIGFQMNGLVPVRAGGHGLAPAPGWSGAYDWVDRVPFEALPRAFNPPDGLWATANHDLSKGTAYFLGREFYDPARYHRVRQVLEQQERHSASDFGVLQADEVSLPGREIAALLARNLQPRGALEQAALSELRQWDGRVSADSAAAAIYHAFRHELVRVTHQARAGDLLPTLYGVGPHPVFAPGSSFHPLQSRRVLAAVCAWQEQLDRSDADQPSREVPRAFSAGVELLRRRFGSDVQQWQWGRLHTFQLQHALSVRKPLGLLFNVPSFPMGGDLETVRKVGSTPASLEAGAQTAAYRFIADCADWDASISCILGGQSGHRGSPHYADQVPDWRRVAYHPLAFTRPAVLRHARHTLTLLPGEADG